MKLAQAKSQAASNGNLNYNIAPEKFEAGITALPESQAEIIRWCYFLGKDRGWSLTRLATAVGTSSTTLSRVFRGEYGAGLDGICATLEKAKSTLSESADNPDFIPTSLGKQIFTICDHARALRTEAILWGDMGIGKTTCLQEYQRLHNHGRTIYYRCEPGMTLVQFISSLGDAIGITQKSRQTQLRVREKTYSILAAGQRLLIIDELHQLFLRRAGADLTPILQCEYIRTIYDKANCGVILAGTKTLERFMVDQKDALAQLLDRGTMPIHLPAKPTADDARAFVRAFGLPPLTGAEPEASSIIADILRSSGLRKLTLYLRAGAAYASKRREPYNWFHFTTAFEDLQSLAR